MKQLLPLVKPETGYSVTESMEGNDKTNIKNGLEQIRKENPFVAEFIEIWSNKGKDKQHTAFCGIIIYKLLRSQAEADEMKKLI